MFDSAKAQPPVPGKPTRKDPNPPAPPERVPTGKEETTKHYFNGSFTMDPTTEKSPEPVKAHGPAAEIPAGRSEGTIPKFVGSPYPTADAHHDRTKMPERPEYNKSRTLGREYYIKDSNGNYIRDNNGNYVIDSNGNYIISHAKMPPR